LANSRRELSAVNGSRVVLEGLAPGADSGATKVTLSEDGVMTLTGAVWSAAERRQAEQPAR
jgi:hypothetical protein